jgi:BASS family bile acid:Na+ symporter
LLSTQGKGLALILTMLVGVFIPQAHTLTFLIRYFLMVMLFFAFLDIDFKLKSFSNKVIWVLFLNIAIAFGAYGLLAPRNTDLALAAFMTAAAPTAIAAPVITAFVQRKVEYVVASVVLTNLTSAIVIPTFLPSLHGSGIRISVDEVLRPVLVVMLVPLILAHLTSRLSAGAQKRIRRGKATSFPLWIANLFIISANASHYLRGSNTESVPTLAAIALISLVICVINFSAGFLLGGRNFWQEAGQSLGHKNLSFVIWIALAFINPLVALGPTFYLLYHHLYNAWLIQHFERARMNDPV